MIMSLHSCSDIHNELLLCLQEHHAMLVVRAVREINELRFVLCPKRMTDEQFWKIYFILCKRYLPDTAFDPSFQPGSSTGPQEKIVVGPFGTLDIHSKLQQWQQAAQHFGQQTAAQLKTAAATRGFGGAATASQSGSPVSVSLHELAERGLHPGFATGNGDEGELHHAGLSADPDLEAYLREVESRHAGNGHKDANDKASSHDGSDASIIDGDVDGEEGESSRTTWQRLQQTRLKEGMTTLISTLASCIMMALPARLRSRVLMKAVVKS